MNGLTVCMVIVVIASTASSLECYDCGPDLLQQMQQMRCIQHSEIPKCLTSGDNYGMVTKCDEYQSACAKGVVDTCDTTMVVRMCLQQSAHLAGQCQEKDIFGMKVNLCFCVHKDLCNGTSPFVSYLLQFIFFALPL